MLSIDFFIWPPDQTKNTSSFPSAFYNLILIIKLSRDGQHRIVSLFLIQKRRVGLDQEPTVDFTRFLILVVKLDSL